MTRREALEEFRDVLTGLSERAREDARLLFIRLDLTMDPAVVSRILQEALPELIDVYGDVAATAAADYYEAVRGLSAGRLSSYQPLLAPNPPVAQVQASTRWAVSGLFKAADEVDPEAVLANVQKVTDRLTKAPARDTLAEAVRLDPDSPRFARIPRGASTCRFCTVMASRGAVYLSEETAGGLTDFHDLCDCAVQQIYEGDALPEGYDPDFYFERYQALGGSSIDLSVRDFGSQATASGAPAATVRAA